MKVAVISASNVAIPDGPGWGLTVNPKSLQTVENKIIQSRQRSLPKAGLIKVGAASPPKALRTLSQALEPALPGAM